MKLSQEAKVGALVVSTLVLALLFAWIIGVKNPFSRSLEFYVTYNFAGGIEVGSPVRVGGIKVGRVERIDFSALTKKTPWPSKSPAAWMTAKKKSARRLRSKSP